MDAIYQKPDFHMHSAASDGSDRPGELLEKVKKAGIDIFSLTDHDTVEGCQEVQAILQPGDPIFLPGVEFSCEKEKGKYHILGYGVSLTSPALQEVLDFTHRERVQKLWDRLAYLETQGFSFLPQEKAALAALKNPGKPHLVKLLLDSGRITSHREGYEILAGYHGRDRLISPEQAISTILAAGGIPVLAHGILGGGALHLGPEEIRARVLPLRKAGLMGLECYYSTYTPQEEAIMLDLAQAQGLLITAGSDYHGSNKQVALGQTGRLHPDLLRPFYKAISDKL